MRLGKPVFLIWLLSLCLLALQGGLGLHALGHATEQLAQASVVVKGGALIQAGEHCALCDGAALLSSGLPASAPALPGAAAVFSAPAEPVSVRLPAWPASHPARAPPSAV